MIHHHGGPITPSSAAVEIWSAKHAMVSFAHPDQVGLVADVCQSFAFDNGAFSIWKRGGTLDVRAYARWVDQWRRHPGFDWALIPDSIEGDEAENDRMIAAYREEGAPILEDVPVWHMHESLDRLWRLCWAWKRVAIGSSGEFADIGTVKWWLRMDEALNRICRDGVPIAKLHGLRMLDPAIFGKIPFASADSTNVARNIGIDSRWTGAYTPASKRDRGLVIAGRIEAHNSASKWTALDSHYKDTQVDLFGVPT